MRPYFCLNVPFYNTIPNKFWNFSCSVDEIAEDQACLDETDEVQKHRVCILGTNDVGKTSLVNQFLTSEYMNTYDASLGMLCLCMYYGFFEFYLRKMCQFSAATMSWVRRWVELVGY